MADDFSSTAHPIKALGNRARKAQTTGSVSTVSPMAAHTRDEKSRRIIRNCWHALTLIFVR